MNMNVIQKSYLAVERIFSNLMRVPHRMSDGSWWNPLESGTWVEVEALKSFIEIPEVNAVITRKATGFANGQFKVVNKDGVEKKNDLVNKLLLKPNWFQSQKEFMMQTCLFHEIFGNEYLYAFLGRGLKLNPQYIGALYTLPPNLMHVCYEDTLPFYKFANNGKPKVKYEIDNNGKRDELPIEQIIHLNENRVNVKSANDKDILKGTSQLELLRAPLNNIRMAYESRGVILKYRGALGVLSPGSKDALGSAMPMEYKERMKLQKEYKKTYGGLSNQFQIMVSSVPVTWQQMGINPDKLGLMQETAEDFRKVKDAYQAPDELFASEKGSTYENQNQGWKRWYEGTIIPDANERLGGLNEWLMEDSNFKIVVDYSHLPIFQEDVKHRAEALAQYVNALSALYADDQLSSDEYREELKKRFEIGDGKAIVVEKEKDVQPTDPNAPISQPDPTTEDQPTEQPTNE